MFKCQIADFKICFEDYLGSLKHRIGHFYKKFTSEDIKVIITQNDILNERRIDNGINENMNDAFFEEVAAFRNLAEILPQYDALVMHSCLISVANIGVAFTAPSGTGKTTHMLLWKKLLKDKMTIINGDKPIIRFTDGDFYGYGTPWCGKENLYSEKKVPLKHICKIERSKINKTVQMSKEEGMSLLLQQVYMPKDAKNLAKTMELVSNIVENVEFWTIYCNMDDEAAEIAQKAIMFHEYDDLIYNENNLKDEFTVQNNTKVMIGKWIPVRNRSEFVVRDIPFTPKKILISCNDVLFSKKTDDNAYFVNLNIDLDSKRCLGYGGAITNNGGNSFAINRRSLLCESINISEDGVEIKPLIIDDKYYYFKSDCEYSWIIIG